LKIDDMSEGRAMDALVAEKIMKLPGIHQVGHYLFYTPTETKDMMTSVPSYSTDLNDAWKIVRTMQQIPLPDGDGFAFELQTFGDLCVAVFKHPLADSPDDEIFEYWHEGRAYNAAKAISIAALKAVGVTSILDAHANYNMRYAIP